MPAELVPPAAIPGLAAQVTPNMLEALRQTQQTGFVRNHPGLDAETADSLRQLAQLGLLDVAYEGDNRDRPCLWSSNGNGSRVLGYLTGIRAGPHYEVPAAELAAWLQDQGEDRWWYVDGDPLLTGRMTFPCPGGSLAAELRRIDRPLLVRAREGAPGANGQVIGKDRLNDLVEHFVEPANGSAGAEWRRGSGDRLLYLCWKGGFRDWLLVEDRETTDQMKADALAPAAST